MNYVHSLSNNSGGNEELTDTDIVQKVLTSDPQMYKIIINRYNQRLFNVIYSIVNNQENAREILQQTYVKAFEKLTQFKGHSDFSTWLTRIAINESLMMLRKEKKYVRMDNYFNQLTVHSNMYGVFSSQRNNPEINAIRNEIRGFLNKAIDSIPHKYSIVFHLREIEGLDVCETSQSLHISKVNVKVRLHRAKKLLRDQLKAEHSNEDILWSAIDYYTSLSLDEVA